MIGRRRALVGLSACMMAAPLKARADSQTRARRIVFINPGLTGEDFWEDVSAVMRAAADQLGFLVEIRMAERERSRIRAMSLAAAAEDPAPDALLLVNEEQSAGAGALAAVQRGIPTLFLLNELTGEDAVQIGPPRQTHPSYLGSLVPDNRQAGRDMAEALFAKARQEKWYASDGKLHFLALGGEMATPAGSERSIGMREAAEAAVDVVLDRHLSAGWSQSEARQITRRYLDWALRASIRPCGVWAASDGMALGAIAAFEDTGLLAGRDAGFVGLNWSQAGLHAVSDQRMLMSEGGHLFCGAWALVLLHDWFAGLDFATGGRACLRFGMAGIDRDNLSAYDTALGHGKFERIDFRSFTRTSRRAQGMDNGGYDFSLDAVLAAASGPAREDGR